MSESKIIYLSVSDVATAIGQNQYNKPETIARKILTSQYGIDENKALTKIENVLDKVLPLQEIVTIAKSKMQGVAVDEQVAQTSARVEDKVREMIAQEKSNITELDPEIEKEIEKETKAVVAELPKLIAGKVSQTTGILSETKIVDTVEIETKTRVKERNCVMKYLYIEIPGTEFTIKVGGKPDGTMTDPISKKVMIVEAKNRQNRLFDKIPPYEQVAISLYMRLWKSDACQFVQNFRGETRREIVKFSARKYQNIETGLIHFCRKHVIPKISGPSNNV